MKLTAISHKLLEPTSSAYDVVTPMSPSTMKVQRRQPGGLLWWQTLSEVAFNFSLFLATIYLAMWINPAFAIIWVVMCSLICMTNVDLLRFKLFARRKESVSTRFEPAEIPIALVERYEKASSDLRQVMLELEHIAAANGIAPNEGLRRWAKESDS
jgi:hypothetical protein